MSSLVPVTTTSWGMEYSVHGCSNRVQTEIKGVFPGIDTHDLLVVPTCQQADIDLVRTGDKVDIEKDRLLEQVRPACSILI
eukprot:jgi/Chrzof1/1165/Cz01g43050.t1